MELLFHSPFRFHGAIISQPLFAVSLLRQQQTYILRIIFNLFGPAAGGFQRIPGAGGLEQDEPGAVQGVPGQELHAVWFFLIQLPVEDELVQPVEKGQRRFFRIGRYRSRAAGRFSRMAARSFVQAASMGSVAPRSR